jgi:hypothetical protein
MEAALEALRAADNDAAQQRAMDRLEKAIKKLHKQSGKERPGAVSPPPGT